MPLNLDPCKDFANLAVGGNHERGSDHAHRFFAVHVLFLPDAVGFAHGPFGIGQQWERQLILIHEFLVGCR